MQNIKRARVLVKNTLLLNVSKLCKGLGSAVVNVASESPSVMGFAPFSSLAAGNTSIHGITKRASSNSSYSWKFARDMSYKPKVSLEPIGLPASFSKRSIIPHLMVVQSPLQPALIYILNSSLTSSSRFFASKASESKEHIKTETRKDVSTFQDPFDSPTYNIPEKPVTFTEGASYSLIILVGLGIAAAAAYAVFKELIFQPKEYKIFGKALERIQGDGQVRVRIGAPITGYGSESKNRAARQRIPNRTWTDEDGVEHVEVNFYIRGPHGSGKVFTEMFKDKEDRQWKFTYLIVEIKSPAPAQLMLESYVPA